ncbi:MAG: AAA family ATPase [Bryobacterales bacterium]|nr:AAA family ATPase [Bryobacteraceae bacterium]MDW8129378.1 AAA family ATPase [Bryobacterales bacterium]
MSPDGLEALVELIITPGIENWRQRAETAFAALFGSQGGRYPEHARRELALRAPEMRDGVPFAALIHKSNPSSGPYGGLSFVVFPVEGDPALFGLVVGTNGLAPDEGILGRPGHARKVQAICAWLRRREAGRFCAWAKQDPTRLDLDIPQEVRKQFPQYKAVFDRYGKVIYGFYVPGTGAGHRYLVRDAAAAFLDLHFRERGVETLKSFQQDASRIQKEWSRQLLPAVDEKQIARILERYRFVILQGPPGTGKTRIARELLRGAYGGFGRSIQFHANTSYEHFLGGLAPLTSGDPLGFRFAPARGLLMEAAAEALACPGRPYLLHVDEINRADLAKVLGEAIFLLELEPEYHREIELPYDFGPPFGRRFWLPPNLRILGTMNSADRSIALVDIAIRRRFHFVNVWPRLDVVEEHASELAIEAYRKLLDIFVEHASEDAFCLLPGHAYFLVKDEARTAEALQLGLAPLLEEYLAQGYVTGFAEEIRAYLQWLRTL